MGGPGTPIDKGARTWKAKIGSWPPWAKSGDEKTTTMNIVRLEPHLRVGGRMSAQAMVCALDGSGLDIIMPEPSKSAIDLSGRVANSYQKA